MKKKQYKHPVCRVMKMRPIFMLANSAPEDPEQKELDFDPNSYTDEVL